MLPKLRDGESVDRLVQQYEAAFRRSPTWLNAYLYGRALFLDGKLDKSMAVMQQALQIFPGLWNARVAIVNIHLKKGTGTMTLRALEIPGSQVMDFRLMLLTRVEE